MDERLVERFADEIQARGYDAWWEAEEVWEEIGEVLVAEGFDAEAVEAYIAEMAADI